MSRVVFVAQEYQPDGSIAPARYVIEGEPAEGWRIEREGRPHLHFGPGYRLLRVSHCGVCATDLARRHLPYPLPQITGHEAVAVDEDGAPVVVEINASCLARGIPPCEVCRAGMPTHCPERRVLGIHDLPGGFGSWFLAPRHGVVRVPAAIPAVAATFVEPFAAAWRAVEVIAPRPGDRILVLGPGRLGSLVVAALDAWRGRKGVTIEILAAARSSASRDRARRMGADATFTPDEAPEADIVVDATGSPDASERALSLARRELHVKSTTGQPALGLGHLTELVVDELTIARAPGALPAGAVVAHTPAEIDAAIRPTAGLERSAVGPRGMIHVADAGQPRTPLLEAILGRDLRVTSSRCGDFHAALEVLAEGTRSQHLASELVRAIVSAEHLTDAFDRAGSEGGKIVVAHPGGLV
jgi:threonine dehydrogenase-like Zn-dependent dehydrogenase